MLHQNDNVSNNKKCNTSVKYRPTARSLSPNNLWYDFLWFLLGLFIKVVWKLLNTGYMDNSQVLKGSLVTYWGHGNSVGSWTVTCIFQNRSWIRSVKPSLQHLQFCRFGLSPEFCFFSISFYNCLRWQFQTRMPQEHSFEFSLGQLWNIDTSFQKTKTKWDILNYWIFNLLSHGTCL
jgi:hypothetical protein